MSRPKPPNPAKLVVGLLMKDKQLLSSVVAHLVEKYGTPDLVSAWLDFNYTAYYEPEMGSPLFRRIFSFTSLIDQQSLAGIKHATNDIETVYCTDNRRRVNIDPGYLLNERFVLATGKNFAHRIYVGQNIYADLTLVYVKGAYRSLEWTYPDYASRDIIRFLDRVRRKYNIDLKNREGKAQATGTHMQ
ncbi:MAG: DUF4416 family protein [Deltaproteobacteria bacterium]|nr:DUF4416 family protein [Deltaproteobacteria bacterium]